MTDMSGTILDGKYELSSLLGEGGMGAVYEATHLLIGRRLAVKFLHPQYVTSQEVVTRFQREAQAAAAIGHENIIEVTDMGMTPDGAPYIVMEYLDGSDVKQVLSTETLLEPERAAHIMVQALSGLQAAHNAGIIHRDLKPENIYLIEKPDRPDYVKLLDFGISKFKSLEAEGAKNLTQTGTVLGTPYYMSPEQARGDQDLSHSSDVYAMGVILYQMLTGKLPFDAPNYNALLIKILTEDPVPPEDLNPDLPPEIADIIKIAMSREAADRFEDCNEFKKHLAPFVPGSSGIRIDTQLSQESRTAVRAALATTNHTPLELSQTGVMAQKKRTPLIIGGSVVASLAILAVLFFGILGKNSDEGTAANVPLATPEDAEIVENSAGSDSKEDAKPEDVFLKITATPKDATIKIDDEKVDNNPFEGSYSKDDKVHTIAITSEGYETETAEINFNQDQILSYKLIKSEPEPKSKNSSKRRRKSSSRRGSKPGSSAATKGTKPGKKPQRKIDDEDPWS